MSAAAGSGKSDIAANKELMDQRTDRDSQWIAAQ
jgi:hypothetical protein